MHKSNVQSSSKNKELRLAYFGRKLGHSRLAEIYELCCQSEDIHLDFKAFEVEPGDVVESMLALKKESGRHICITVPYKVVAYELCDKLTERAMIAGSVNVIRNIDGVFYGDNTDGDGFIRDIVQNHGYSFEDKRVLILGAGGVMRGMLNPILQQLPREVFVCNRDQQRLEALKEDFHGEKIHCIDYAGIPKSEFDFVINTTSASISDTLLPLPKEVIGEHTVCVECAYRIGEYTVFQKWALEQGASAAISGLGMLVEQAAEAKEFFLDVVVDTPKVLRRFDEYREHRFPVA